MTRLQSRLPHMGLTLAAGLALGGPALADIQHLDDVIITFSLCVGNDCVNGESFGFDTLRLKENNVRIKFDDTSTSASFPKTDWQLTANDTSNGGAEKFSIDDISNSRTPFTIEASTPSHALYVDNGGSKGRIGFGTSTPVVDLHVVSGNTPTLRLEQDGSSGFTAQTWDVAGNEAGFFIRDATNGSQLAFRIKAGADEGALYIAANNDVGMGTTSPSEPLHVRRTDGTAKLLVEEANGTASNTRILLQLTNNGASQLALVDTGTGADWRFQNFEDKFRVNKAGTGVTELSLDASGNLTILGTLTEGSDKNAKMAIEPVDHSEILDKIAALDVSAWTYKRDADTGIRHIGPMAQDFHALFGLGATETGISTLDTSGVALAAIKALQEQNAALLARIEVLESAR